MHKLALLTLAFGLTTGLASAQSADPHPAAPPATHHKHTSRHHTRHHTGSAHHSHHGHKQGSGSTPRTPSGTVQQ
jgi:hypothetical protein